MTTEELLIVKKLSEAYEDFLKLPRSYGNETQVFSESITTCQTILMARDAVRNHPEVFCVVLPSKENV